MKHLLKFIQKLLKIVFETYFGLSLAFGQVVIFLSLFAKCNDGSRLFSCEVAEIVKKNGIPGAVLGMVIVTFLAYSLGHEILKGDY